MKIVKTYQTKSKWILHHYKGLPIVGTYDKFGPMDGDWYDWAAPEYAPGENALMQGTLFLENKTSKGGTFRDEEGRDWLLNSRGMEKLLASVAAGETDMVEVAGQVAYVGYWTFAKTGTVVRLIPALERATKVAIVLGSDGQARSARNPFTSAERVEMISSVYPKEVAEGRIAFVFQADHPYNLERWIAGVQSGVFHAAQTPFTPDSVRIGLIGHSKDHTSFYLSSFPQWGSIEVANLEGIDATDIRNGLFDPEGDMNAGFNTDKVPPAVHVWLNEWGFRPFVDNKSPSWLRKGFLSDKTLSDECRTVVQETDHVRAYKRQWSVAPYPPIFQTVDSVVVQSGHILLVKRGGAPGKGLWALPGGFLDQNETLQNGALRELREETGLIIEESVLFGSLRAQRVFDDPHRSSRGRTITTAFHFELVPRETLPAVVGGDDAVNAEWVPLSKVRRVMMFEDHYDIIETMVGL